MATVKEHLKFVKQSEEELAFWVEGCDEWKEADYNVTLRYRELILAMAKKWEVIDWEVIDFDMVPNEYKAIDASKIGRVVRAGLHAIPGIRIWEEETLKVTARKPEEG